MKTTKTTITLTNEFHNTSVDLQVNALKVRPNSTPADILDLLEVSDDTEINAMQCAILTPSQISRAQKTLCGHNGCCCGDVLGQRGDKSLGLDVDYDESARIEIIKIYF